MTTTATAPFWWFTLRLSNSPQAPRIARSHVRTTLNAYQLGELADSAELLTSEVVTNAHRYAQGPITVRAQWETARRCLRVSSCDVSDVGPRVVTENGDDEGGRGLRILDLCATAWGWFPLHDPRRRFGGKVVWFELGSRAGGTRLYGAR
ncbi:MULTISPECIES: ATP-binding protein [unclassified Streptomyces]|uniref:ATP-binding protein n=1 Tax=unclassified Streptomyces TaxID=2593676 RepID=UPI0022B6596D|nr:MULTISPECIES: ATP-binding protein [unclassified Streptomyces]MCZ7417141.1 ATP-binding protein [Streptomyces sp. WMMC897]MCZ7433030.1 ATP-binding protein [Streptomyces sp. WMMC1477]